MPRPGTGHSLRDSRKPEYRNRYDHRRETSDQGTRVKNEMLKPPPPHRHTSASRQIKRQLYSQEEAKSLPESMPPPPLPGRITRKLFESVIAVLRKNTRLKKIAIIASTKTGLYPLLVNTLRWPLAEARMKPTDSPAYLPTSLDNLSPEGRRIYKKLEKALSNNKTI